MTLPNKRDPRFHDFPQKKINLSYEKIPICWICKKPVANFYAFKNVLKQTVTFIAKCCNKTQEETFNLEDYVIYQTDPNIKAFYAFRPKGAPPEVEVLPAE